MRDILQFYSNQTKDGPVSINPKDLEIISKFAKMDQEEKIDKLNLHHPNWEIMLGKVTENLMMKRF